jgi:membrane-bound lytic murein transglycosylase A
MRTAPVPSPVSISANGGGLGKGPRVAALFALALASCTTFPASISPPSAPSHQPRLVALDVAECRSVIRDDAPATSLQQAVARSVDYLGNLPSGRALPVVDHSVTAGELATMMHDVGSADGICDRFRLYRAELPQGLLVTGYYQPELPARRTRSDRFRYPLYRIPDNLVDADLTQFCPACSGRVIQGRVKDGRLVPYYSRAEIDAGGVLADHGYEIAWLDDPVEAFFLHVQGSALLHFDDGVQMQISYAGSNGRPYTSLGRVLVERGKMERNAVSLQTLKDYLRAHPAEQEQLMETNQRYIFFHPVIAGPVGSMGVPLTAGRSIAADARVYPRGALAFLRVLPRNDTAVNQEPVLSRLVLVQDAGVAISGPSRIDLFLGTGATAEIMAGDMRNPGEIFVVLPQ